VDGQSLCVSNSERWREKSTVVGHLRCQRFDVRDVFLVLHCVMYIVIHVSYMQRYVRPQVCHGVGFSRPIGRPGSLHHVLIEKYCNFWLLSIYRTTSYAPLHSLNTSSCEGRLTKAINGYLGVSVWALSSTTNQRYIHNTNEFRISNKRLQYYNVEIAKINHGFDYASSEHRSDL
jgi:hypothetical protein